jgi:hypothetical protein
VLGARLLMPDIKCLGPDHAICVGCQEMPTWMEEDDRSLRWTKGLRCTIGLPAHEPEPTDEVDDTEGSITVVVADTTIGEC